MKASPYPAPLTETLERLRLTLDWDLERWCELAALYPAQWLECQRSQSIPALAVSRIARQFGLDPVDVVAGKLNYRQIARRHGPHHDVPERYQVGAFSRMRTVITSLDGLEELMGWRLRLGVLRQLGISEGAIQDPFQTVSIRLITEIAGELRARNCRKDLIFGLGSYSLVGHRNSFIADEFRKCRSVREIYELQFNELIRHYEHNCSYRFLSMSSDSCLLEVRSYPEVADALRVRHLGSPEICELKAGMIASFPGYLDLPFAAVDELACAHYGADSCIFEVDFSLAQRLLERRRATPLSSRGGASPVHVH